MTATHVPPITRPDRAADTRRRPAVAVPEASTTGFRRATAIGLLAACGSFAVGAGIWSTTGVGYDAAVQSGTVADIVADIVAHRVPLTATFSLWLLGSVLFGLTSRFMAASGVPTLLRTTASALMGLGAALGLAVFLVFIAVVTAFAATTDVSVTAGLLALASAGDWIVTVLVIGTAPPLFVLAARDEWAPSWLVRAGVAPPLASIATLAALVSGTGLDTFGFALVPVGMSFAILTSVVILRRS